MPSNKIHRATLVHRLEIEFVDTEGHANQPQWADDVTDLVCAVINDQGGYNLSVSTGVCYVPGRKVASDAR